MGNLDAFLDHVKINKVGELDPFLSRLLSCPELCKGVCDLTKIVHRFNDRSEAVNKGLVKAHKMTGISRGGTCAT